MKENKYDDPEFFSAYAGMTRSKLGLAGAGEWPELEKLLPDFSSKRVLDLGCGYGWHCAYAAAHGAHSVLGVDISSKMLDEAARRNGGGNIEYRRAAMEDLVFAEGSFDLVLSSLALHYVRDYPKMIRNISEWLAPNGAFIFSTEHPVFTARGDQDWYRDAQGNILHFPVDRYFDEGEREAVFLGQKVIKYHRTLTTLLGVLLENGFLLRAVVEPQPPQTLRHLPEMQNELRRPMMLLVSAVKQQ